MSIMSPTELKIMECIETYLMKGMKDKHIIYTKVVEELNVPRPKVRRIARDLRHVYLERIQILQN